MDTDAFFAHYDFQNCKFKDIKEKGTNFVFDCKTYLLFNVTKYFTKLICQRNVLPQTNVDVFGFFHGVDLFKNEIDCLTDIIEIFDNTLRNYRYSTFKGKFISFFNNCSSYFKTHFKYSLSCSLKNHKFIITLTEDFIRNGFPINKKPILLSMPFYFDLSLFYLRDKSEQKLIKKLNDFYKVIEQNYQKTYFWENDDEIKSAYSNCLSE